MPSRPCPSDPIVDQWMGRSKKLHLEQNLETILNSNNVLSYLETALKVTNINKRELYINV